MATLSLLDVTLSPSFSSAVTSYTASVPWTTSSTRVTATVTDSTATFTVQGSPTTSGVQSSLISLNVGSNTITIVSTAQDGTTVRTYTVTITRAPGN